MEQTKIGELIRKIRKEKNMTQLQLAEKLCVSDKTISKWECGGGCPDLSMFGKLSEVLGIDTDSLVNGAYKEDSYVNGKNISFHICPVCGNIIYQIGGAGISCCGHRLPALVPQEADEDGQLNVQRIENEYYISSAHEMTREHYISFIAFSSCDTLIIKKLYPEWNLETRLPCFARGRLFWYCTNHGLFFLDI